jgi:hypothetical protein
LAPTIWSTVFAPGTFPLAVVTKSPFWTLPALRIFLSVLMLPWRVGWHWVFGPLGQKIKFGQIEFIAHEKKASLSRSSNPIQKEKANQKSHLLGITVTI